jgi:hypothetical protein
MTEHIPGTVRSSGALGHCDCDCATWCCPCTWTDQFAGCDCESDVCDCRLPLIDSRTLGPGGDTSQFEGRR